MCRWIRSNKRSRRASARESGTSSEADAEFAAQVESYDDRQPGLGGRFYREVIRTLEWIAEHPTLPRMRRNYRRVNLKISSFYIAYVTQNDLIWVLAVAHGHKKTGYGIARMKGE